jgi:hypothetical protein
MFSKNRETGEPLLGGWWLNQVWFWKRATSTGITLHLQVFLDQQRSAEVLFVDVFFSGGGGGGRSVTHRSKPRAPNVPGSRATRGADPAKCRLREVVCGTETLVRERCGGCSNEHTSLGPWRRRQLSTKEERGSDRNFMVMSLVVSRRRAKKRLGQRNTAQIKAILSCSWLVIDTINVVKASDGKPTIWDKQNNNNY